MDLSALAERFVALVRDCYPGWTGIYDPRFTEHETGYKRQASAKARDLLSAEAFRTLLANEQYDEVLGRLRKVGQSTNLLYLATPSTGDLAILHHGGSPKPLAAAFQDLLHGPGTSAERLDRFATFADRAGLPNKWAFPTCLLFLVSPETDFFVKPSIARWLLDQAGVGGDWASQPNGRVYQRLLDVAAGILNATKHLGASDLIDVQSLIWVARMITNRNGIPRWDTFVTLLDRCDAEYLRTPTGRKHLASYPNGRRQARESFTALKTRRAAGADVTADVLLRCLPHADNPGNVERGAWIHVAPTFAGDVQTKFEGSGWRRPEDWPQVARLLLDFYVECDDNPGNLDAACRKFSSSPFSTGFQTGTVTPFLAALRPDDFTLINNKSRRLINFFMETGFKQPLVDYPATNVAAHRLEKGIPPTILSALPSDGHPSDILDAFAHWLVAVAKFDFGSSRYWKVAPGEKAWQWEECLRDGFIGIGWDELGDLAGISKPDFEARLDELLPNHGDWTKQGARQAYRFATKIAEGDRVVANRGISEVLGIGTVTGPYYYEANGTHRHRFPVDWDDIAGRQVNEPAWVKTLVRLDEAAFARVISASSDEPPEVKQMPLTPAEIPPGAAYSLDTCAEETGIELGTLKTWFAAIERKGQAIIYGPPGTGKTYVAERLARYLAGADGLVELVQFHPSYAYEDFIQGIRPKTDGGSLQFAMQPGRFLAFCDRARGVRGTAVLIIDEINRSNLSKVFGELMYLLEYRRQEVPLAGGGRFSIPERVRIIGTMNTADRSVALVDHALRRRFAFIPLFPDFDILERYQESRGGMDVEPLVVLLKKLNEDIGDRNLGIGISFFMREELADELEWIWRLEIEPYLEEVFFDREHELAKYRWDAIAAKVAAN